MLHLLFVTLASLGSLTILAFLVLSSIYYFRKHSKLFIQNRRLPYNHEMLQSADSSSKHLELIAHKLNLKLMSLKMYTNPDLSINDLATEIGTNRSYISATINKFYHKNFCTYINEYRFRELEVILLKEMEYSHKELAMKCGFGSTDSMKRTVKLITGLTFREWKQLLINGVNTDFSDN